MVLTKLTKENMRNKPAIIILLILFVIAIVLFFLIFNYFKSPEKQLNLGVNIEEVIIDEDGSTTYIKLAGGSNIEDVIGVKFIFKDKQGGEYYYETSEGIQEISVPYNKSILDIVLGIFGKAPDYEGVYDYEINAEELGLDNFEGVKEVGIVFAYGGEGEETETKVLDTEKPKPETDKIAFIGGGGGGGGGGGAPTCTPNCVGKECGDDGCGGSCGSCNINNETCSDGECVRDCKNENDAGCSVGGIFCNGNMVYNCNLNDSDGCYDRVNGTECGTGFECINGTGCMEISECSADSACSSLNNECSYGNCNIDGKCEVVFNSSSDVCRGALGKCDIAEYCTGDSSVCPENAFADYGTSCTDDNLFCTGIEICQSGNCTNSGNPCSSEEICNENTDSCEVIICMTSLSTWQNFLIDSQNSAFTVEFNAIPNDNNIDGVTALSSGEGSAYSDFAVLVRFNSSGYIEARNTGDYDADVLLPYSSGTSYHFKLVIDILNQIYDVNVTPESLSEQKIATDYGFRVPASNLDNLGLIASNGSYEICDFEITEAPACQLTNAYWDPIGPVDEGTIVNLNVHGNNCQNEIINYTVYKSIWWWFDQQVMQTSTQGSTSWQTDSDGTFYFKAVSEDGLSGEVTSPDLIVNQVTAVCGDGSCNGAEVCGDTDVAPECNTDCGSCPTVNTYYIRSDATGNNDGSDWTNAYTSFPDLLERGAIYFIADGTYPGYTFNDPASGTEYITIKKATIDEHGASIGWQTSYGDGQAIFGPLTFNTDYYIFDGQSEYGFEVRGEYQGLTVDLNSNYVTIRNSDLDGNFQTDAGGYHIDGSCNVMNIDGSYAIIENSDIHNAADDGIGVYGDDIKIIENKIHNLHGCGCDPMSTCSDWRANGECGPCYNGHSDGFELHDTANVEIKGNIIYDLVASQTGALMTGQWSPGLYIRNLTLENNIFYTPTTGLTVYIRYVQGAKIFNNVIWGRTQGTRYGGLAIGQEVTDMDLYNNIILNINYNHLGAVFDPVEHRIDYNLFAMIQATEYTANTNDIIGDPIFKDIIESDDITYHPKEIVAENFSLQGGSPAINNGTDGTAQGVLIPTTDYFGNLRDALPDMGAVEYGCVDISDCSDMHCNDKDCVAGSCVYTPNDALSCDDGLFCTGVETCQLGVCVNSGNPCSGGEICIEPDICQQASFPTDYVSWWKFDGNANDETGNNNGVVNGTEFINDNIRSQVASFDGIYDYIQVGTTNWDLNKGTISLWGNADAFSGPRYFFGHNTGTGAGFSDRIQLYTDTGSNLLRLGLGDSHILNTNVYYLDANTWYHITLTWDGTNYAVYVDGNAEAIGTYSGLTALEAFSDIGNDGHRAYRDESFDGMIDEVMVFDRSLSSTEILQIYNSQLIECEQDSDKDGYGAQGTNLSNCFSKSEYDCVDNNEFIFPTNTNTYCDCDNSDGYDKGTTEICDGYDNDCDGIADGPDVCEISYYYDNDKDGFNSSSQYTCDIFNCEPAGATDIPGNDCDDYNAEVYPGAQEICDSVANDCNNPVNIDIALDISCPGSEVCISGSCCLDLDSDGNCDIQTTTQITQFGITWTFSEPVAYGKFANEDYWVIGPVNITSISPLSTEIQGTTTLSGFTPDSSGNYRTMHGSMLNPSPKDGTWHGYDSEMCKWTTKGESPYPSNYDYLINVALDVSASKPLMLQPGSSLVSTISNEAGKRPQVKTAAVLTVLNEPAPEGSFRPPYSGTDKTIRFNKNQLDSSYSLLSNLDPVAETPSLSTVERYFERPWIDHIPDWRGRYHHPSYNMPNYGKDMAIRIGIGALILNLNFTNAEKEKLLVRYVQLGIDLYGIIQDDGENNWVPNGGHAQGRKLPILFSGLMLNEPNMINIGSYDTTGVHFGEDDQTFYVSQTEVNRNYDSGCGGFTQEHIGMPEWGIRHSTYPNKDDIDWTYGCSIVKSYRRCCTARSFAGFVLAAQIMDVKDLWNHDALLYYQDRYMEIETPGTSDRQESKFLENMWDTYRADYGCVWKRDDPSDTYSLGYYSCPGSEQKIICKKAPDCKNNVCERVNLCKQYKLESACDYDPCGFNKCKWTGKKCIGESFFDQVGYFLGNVVETIVDFFKPEKVIEEPKEKEPEPAPEPEPIPTPEPAPEECIPKTCSELGKQCSIFDDSCGNELNCGNCSEGNVCSNGICVSEVLCNDTCSSLNYECGIFEICGDSISCGNCVSGFICESGQCVEEVCIPEALSITCSSWQCGSKINNCGSYVNCGTCDSGFNCESGQCIEIIEPVIEIPQDYVSWWKLEGNADDETGDNNGVVNGVSFINDNERGQVASFDGNDYIYRKDYYLNGQIPSKSSGQAEDFTISAWIRREEGGARHPIIVKEGNRIRGFVFEVSDANALRFQIYKDQSNGGSFSSTEAINADIWYHAVITYDYIADGSSEAKLYINGNLDKTHNTMIGPAEENSAALEIGRYYWSGSYKKYFNGLIDDVMIYDSVLNETEIQKIYCSQGEGTEEFCEQLVTLSPFTKFWNWFKGF